MSSPPPFEGELFARAEQALGHAGADAQVTAWWEAAPGAVPVLGVEVVVVDGGRRGAAESVGADPGDLAALAKRARAAAADGPPAAPLPEAAHGRAHAGYDPAVARLELESGAWRAGAAKTAIVSTRGVRAFEQRSFAAYEPGPLAAAAITPAGIDVAALDFEAAALRADAPPVAPPAGELPAVLGPDAVADVLDRLRAELADGGALAARRGSRVAASAINLSDSPRFGATLPRSYDAAGTPRQPVPLIQDGVAHRGVSAATGHAMAAGLPGARPEHLVLVGGGAADADELMAPIRLGLYLAAPGVGFLVEDGRRTHPVALGSVRIDPLGVLAGVQALTGRQRTLAHGASARTAGATVCPALRTSGGVLVA